MWSYCTTSFPLNFTPPQRSRDTMGATCSNIYLTNYGDMYLAHSFDVVVFCMFSDTETNSMINLHINACDVCAYNISGQACLRLNWRILHLSLCFVVFILCCQLKYAVWSFCKVTVYALRNYKELPNG